jgi:hypothetical protein
MKPSQDTGTKRPWSYRSEKDNRTIIIGANKIIAEVVGYDESEANARLIVKAVNCHDELVEACQKTLNWLNSLNAGLPEDDPILVMQREYHAPYKNVLKQALAKAEAV